MNKKKLDVRAITNELKGASKYFDQPTIQPEKVLPEPPSVKVDAPIAQEPTQEVTQVSKRLSKPLSKGHAPTTDEIENLAFSLRKITKARVNADIPLEWKKRLDDLAHQLEVGKYDLMLFIIARFLDDIGEENV